MRSRDRRNLTAGTALFAWALLAFLALPAEAGGVGLIPSTVYRIFGARITKASLADNRVLTYDASTGTIGWEDAAGAGGDHVVSDSGTNASVEAVAIQHDTDSTSASGFGAHVAFDLEDSGGNLQADAAKLEARYDVATDTSEDTSLAFHTMQGGNGYEAAAVTSMGLLLWPSDRSGTVDENYTASAEDGGSLFFYRGGSGGSAPYFSVTVDLDDSGVVLGNRDNSTMRVDARLLFKSVVETWTAGSGAPITPAYDDSGKTFLATGLSADAYATLPDATANTIGAIFTFVDFDDTYSCVVQTTGSSSDIIVFSEVQTAANGKIRSGTEGTLATADAGSEGASMTLKCVAANVWLATEFTGWWVVGS